MREHAMEKAKGKRTLFNAQFDGTRRDDPNLCLSFFSQEICDRLSEWNAFKSFILCRKRFYALSQNCFKYLHFLLVFTHKSCSCFNSRRGSFFRIELCIE